jgi:hypothetical protein
MFRAWLAARGCRFHQHERGHGRDHAVVTVEREGLSAELPLVGSHEPLDADLVREVCERLGLDWNELPGPQGRA